MTTRKLLTSAILLATLFVLMAIDAADTPQTSNAREEIVFWHFWGGRDRPIVEKIVEQFNASQRQYTVRAIAMPGSNLDLKFFLSVAGGDPPDLLNHDDPIVADWAHRGVLTPLDELATADELKRLDAWLFPAARQLGTYDERLYALCNGLDIRALYCNTTLLAEHGLGLPETTGDLDVIAETIAPSGDAAGRRRMGYLPDPRRLWAWGVVFGGRFANPQARGLAERRSTRRRLLQRSLGWPTTVVVMGLASSRHSVRENKHLRGRRFRCSPTAGTRWSWTGNGACATLPKPSRLTSLQPFLFQLRPAEKNAGWVNGNFFVVPSRARHKQGAWQFMKFWTGFDGHEAEAAAACAAGGWIPASQQVVDQQAYQQALERWPLLKTFVRLASSPDQIPVPSLPVASLYYHEVVQAAQEVLYRGADPATTLQQAAARVRQRLQEVLDEH
ncbi:MAG: extracellular solute-binding protein [Planctomycetes bacterium]|nr:extracellular solute-binding protein [Planctomycetota bacterium]